MRRIIAVAILLSGCGGKRINTTVGPEPDLSHVMAIVGRVGVTGMGSACPVGPTRVLSAAHMADPRPFNPEVGIYPFRYSTTAGDSGVIAPYGVHNVDDISKYEPVKPLEHWYAISENPPEPGETLWWQEYSWESRDSAFRRDVKSSRVTRIVAGHIVLRDSPERGASGSCVVNSKGEVVGIVSFGLTVNWPNGEVGGIVGIWPPWLLAQEESDAKMREIYMRKQLQLEQP